MKNNSIAKYIGGAIIGAGLLLAAYSLASFNPVQTQVYQLAGSGITNNATSVLLTSMLYSNGSAVTMADFGSIGFGTIEPGTPKREEQISFTGISQFTNGQALLTGVTRGLAFNPGTQGCNGSSTLSTYHAGGVSFVLTNTACFYQQFAILSNNSIVSGVWVFSSSSLPTVATNTTVVQVGTNGYNFATVNYANSLAYTGTTPPAGFTGPGSVMIATTTSIVGTIATSSYLGNIYYLAVTSANTSPTSTPNEVVVSNASGSLQSQWYANTNGGTPTVSAANYNVSTTDTNTGTSTWVAPSGLVGGMITLSLQGAQGSSYGANAGLGSSITSTNPVAMGTTYYLGISGGGPAQSPSGYAGGNAAWFSASPNFSTNTVALVAGGGGGGSDTGGGNGGGSTGSAAPNGSGCGGGQGGSQTAGGTFGSGVGTGGANGTFLFGGIGDIGNSKSAGSGGGGFFGGGGGGSDSNNNRCGGGGGSDHFVSSSTATTSNPGSATSAQIHISGLEQIQPTIVGTNLNGTVTVPASTTDITPTTSTINFATSPSFVNVPSCVATTFTSGTTAYVSSISTSSVTFGFTPNIAGQKFSYYCGGH